MMPDIARYALDSCRTIEANTQFLFEKAQEHKISIYGIVNLSNGNFLIRVDRQTMVFTMLQSKHGNTNPYHIGMA